VSESRRKKLVCPPSASSDTPQRQRELFSNNELANCFPPNVVM
jgi:hypothetical protein